jgi:SAM-dependent methyltransferase
MSDTSRWPDQTGLETYARIGERYADEVDARPYNALYERPAMLALLPDVAGRDVLDAGCGSGWYAERLLERGARVTAIDVTPHFVERTRARVGNRATVLEHDLARELPFADRSFDLVMSPLTLHYIEDWTQTLAALARVLRPGGRLLFSTHHPTTDFQLLGTESYFTTELVEDDWGSLGTVTFFRRPLTRIFEALAGAGFLVERVVEPLPLEQMRDVAPEAYTRLQRFPAFLVVLACLPDCV